MVANHEENLPVILKHTIYNELSNSRNPNNMLMIGVIFQTCPEQAANVLAEIFLVKFYIKFLGISNKLFYFIGIAFK